MKIMIRDEQGIKRCFVQLRDIDYIAERFDSAVFKKLALGSRINNDYKQEDFLEITNNGVARIVDENPYIVDFSENVKYDNLTLSRMLLLSRSPVSLGKTKLDEDHKAEDLLDIISFNRGMLTYPIPVLYDEKQLVDDEKVVFGSTTVPGYYMLRSTDEELDLIDYVVGNVNSLFTLVKPESEMKDYSITKLDDCVLVHFEEKKKLFGRKKRITK